jgi:predicted metal-dependent phosphoesterase TrpH
MPWVPSFQGVDRLWSGSPECFTIKSIPASCSFGDDMMKFDLHLHTTRHSPDSRMDPFAMCRRALAIGLDGVVITEHDWLWTEDELALLRELHPTLVVLAGVEVSAREGHFLVYGITNPFAVPRGIGVGELCKEVRRQGGAVAAAHPFRWGQPFNEILAQHKPKLDGLELMTNNMDAACRRQAAEVHKRLGLCGLGSSDAHAEEILGFCYTDFAATIRDMADLVDAIRSRQAVARQRASDVALVEEPGHVAPSA